MKSFYTSLFLLLFSTFSLFAQDGSLDTDFGNNGISILTTPGETARLYALAKSNNQLVTAGFSSPGGTETITILGLNLDGSLNSNFANNGTLVVPQGSGNGRASSIIQQTDGKYLIGGWARNSNKDEYVLIRISENGALDNSFGTNGIVSGSFSSSSFAEDEIAAIGLLSDGKIIVTGRSYGGLTDDVFVGCFNPDGSLFTDFGTNGFSIIDFGNSPPSESATAMTIDAQDNIFLGGGYSFSFGDEDGLFVMKLNNLGVPDASFGTDGVVFHTVDANTIAGLRDIEIDAQGGVVTGGGAFNTSDLDNNFFLTRFTSTGVLDNNFGNNGQVIIQRSSNESIHDLEILPSGDIIAAGSTGGFGSRFAIVRLSSTGIFDPNFGTDGWATTLIGNSFNGIAAITVEAGAIYAAGFSNDGEYQMTLAKYINEGMVGINDLVDTKIKFQTYPNPVVQNFTVAFELQNASKLRMELVDLNGKFIQTLLPLQTVNSGMQQFNFELNTNLPTGTYFVLLQFEDGVIAQKMMK